MLHSYPELLINLSQLLELASPDVHKTEGLGISKLAHQICSVMTLVQQQSF